MRSKPDPLAGVNLVELAPVRATGWRLDGGRAVLERPRPDGSPLRRPLAWLAYAATVKKLRLDEAGTFVWERLDGQASVAQIAAAMRQELGDTVEPAEERISQLVKLLRQEKMVRYPSVDGDHVSVAPDAEGAEVVR